MKILLPLATAAVLLSLQGCSSSEPSNSVLKTSAALVDQQKGEALLDFNKYKEVELKNKKCVLNDKEKSADCEFTLSAKTYRLRFYESGSGWSYSSEIK